MQEHCVCAVEDLAFHLGADIRLEQPHCSSRESGSRFSYLTTCSSQQNRQWKWSFITVSMFICWICHKPKYLHHLPYLFQSKNPLVFLLTESFVLKRSLLWNISRSGRCTALTFILGNTDTQQTRYLCEQRTYARCSFKNTFNSFNSWKPAFIDLFSEFNASKKPVNTTLSHCHITKLLCGCISKSSKHR